MQVAIFDRESDTAELVDEVLVGRPVGIVGERSVLAYTTRRKERDLSTRLKPL